MADQEIRMAKWKGCSYYIIHSCSRNILLAYSLICIPNCRRLATSAANAHHASAKWSELLPTSGDVACWR
jgi:hypothetical protein